MFNPGELRTVILQLLEQEPRHGYDIIRELEERTGGVYAPSPGVVYPTLTMLEELEHIEAQASAGSKKRFAITDAGRTFLDDHRDEADEVFARLDQFAAENRRMDSGPVWRAMQNLRTALQQRLAGISEKEVALNVAEIIDDAARKIERL